MQKILGLDIGSYSIKAIEIVNTFKAYKVTKFYENIIPEIEGLDQSLLGMTAVRQLFNENEIEVDRTYTAMMGLLVSMRVLSLPNVKKRMIPQVVQNELESQAPISLDDVVIDQQVLDSQHGVSTVLAVLSRKDHVEAYLNGLKDLNIEPKVIDVDYLSFMNLYPFLTFDGGQSIASSNAKEKKLENAAALQPRLILDIGHLKTSVVLFSGGKLVAARTIRMGGRYFTDFLQKSLGITFNEAQRVKHAVSRIEFNPSVKSTTGQEREFFVAKNLTLAVSELVKELVRTLHSFKAHERIVPESILLTGGSSVIKNLPEYLEEALGLPVKKLQFDSERLKIDAPELEKTSTISQALAVALRGVPGKEQSQINLRRGELALVGSYDAVLKQVSNISILFASLLFCLVASYGLRWWLYGKQIDNLKKEYRAQVTQIIGTEPKNLKNIAASSSFDLKVYSGQASKYINDEIKARENILTQVSQQKSAAPLRILNEVSRAIPKTIPLDVTNFAVQGNALTLEGETDSFSSSEKILELVKGITQLENVERKSQENKPGSDGKVIKFTLAAVVKEGM